VAFRAGGRELVAVTDDGQVYAWDTEAGRALPDPGEAPVIERPTTAPLPGERRVAVAVAVAVWPVEEPSAAEIAERREWAR
jgi:hypothetical protein